jgi:hypothetical protein
MSVPCIHVYSIIAILEVNISKLRNTSNMAYTHRKILYKLNHVIRLMRANVKSAERAWLPATEMENTGLFVYTARVDYIQ